MIERVAVAVVRRLAEHGDASVVLDVAELAVVRDVAPDEIASLRAPRRAFVPHAAGEQPLDRRVVRRGAREGRIDRDDVGIGIGRRGARIVIAARVRDDRWRTGPRCRGLRARSPRRARRNTYSAPSLQMRSRREQCMVEPTRFKHGQVAADDRTRRDYVAESGPPTTC